MSTPRRALIVIDVQNEYVTGGLRIEYPPVEQSLQRIAEAMDAAQAAGIPIILVQHDSPADAPLFATGSAGWQLHPSVFNRPHDHLIHKTMPGSFTGTELAPWLAERGVDTLTIAGFMSQNCNLSTAVQAAHLGLNVEMLSDATGSVPYENAAGRASAEEVHRVLGVIFHSRLAAMVETGQWIDNLKAGVASEKSNILVSNRQAVGH